MANRFTSKELEQKVASLEAEILERKGIEEGLRRSEERYRNLFEESRDGVAIVDPEGRYISINQAGLDILGYTRENISDLRAIQAYVNVDDMARILSIIEKDGFIRDYEIQARRGTGEIIDCFFSCTARRDQDGKIIEYQAITRDITHRKQSREALRRAHDELELRVKERTLELNKANELLKLELVERKKVEADLRESEKRLRLLSSDLIMAQEKERKRISFELHDELGQSLLALKLRIKSIEDKLISDQAGIMDVIEQARKYIDHIVDNVRRLSMVLSPSILEDLGLSSALRWLMEETARHCEIPCSADIIEVDHLFSQEDQIIIYRIFQEALTNVMKHAQPSHIAIAIKREEGRISCMIKDDGKGFYLKNVSTRNPKVRGLGLAAMEERVWMLGGTLNVRSGHGKGTEIHFSIPNKGRNS
jgi:PAS domain S-box-containing protein